jgi:hypothetical protein
VLDHRLVPVAEHHRVHFVRAEGPCHRARAPGVEPDAPAGQGVRGHHQCVAAAPLAMHEADAHVARLHHGSRRQARGRRQVMVAAHRHHRCDLLEHGDHRAIGEVPGVQDEVAAGKRLEGLRRYFIEELADVRVGDDPDDHP